MPRQPKPRSRKRFPPCCAAAPATRTSSRRFWRRPRTCAVKRSWECLRMSEATGGFIGKSVLRKEDRRLLTGKGEFIADLKLPEMLHAAFVRSQVAHGRIKSV